MDTENLLTRLARTLIACALLVGTAAQAATLEISPNGYLVDKRSIKFVVTAHFRPGATIESFAISYNGIPITDTFLQYAAITMPDAGTAVATVEALPESGSHVLTVTLKVAGEALATGSTTFTVPETDQDRRRKAVITHINEFLHKDDTYLFSSSISLGSLAIFDARSKDPSFQVYIDPVFLKADTSTGATASYVEFAGLSYYRDLVLAIDPDLFSLTREPQSQYSPMIMWHEMVHAVSHLASEYGSGLPDPRPGTGATGEQIDHFYTDWAESCIDTGLPRLKAFEKHIIAQGKGTPSPTALSTGRAHWRGFVTACNTSIDPRGVPNLEQRAAFKRMIGFDIDPASVEGGYRLLGYPKEYFEVATVAIQSPGTISTVNTPTVDVTALVVLEPNARVAISGFLINGAVQQAALAGQTLAASLPLVLGSNTIQAGVVPLDALGRQDEAVLSTPITVTRTGPACPQITSWSNANQSLYAPLRVTRVDHNNSPGRFYFYAWHSPNSPQEKTINITYFSLRAGPSLTRDLSFANNVGIGLYSFASAADANLVWAREMAAWDALLPAYRPDLVSRDASSLVWSWTSTDGTKEISSLQLVRGSVIAAIGLQSLAASESIPTAGMTALNIHRTTTTGLIDTKCGGS